jgi:hypothetical protein
MSQLNSQIYVSQGRGSMKAHSILMLNPTIAIASRDAIKAAGVKQVGLVLRYIAQARARPGRHLYYAQSAAYLSDGRPVHYSKERQSSEAPSAPAVNA